jgi:hypothetical protein
MRLVRRCAIYTPSPHPESIGLLGETRATRPAALSHGRSLAGDLD